ncbi:MAG: ATP synthase F1 subunit epsilon [Bacteriovoracia bacterium]
MRLTIVTPERQVVGPIPVQSATIPGIIGEMTILPGHARLLSTLGTGVLSFERENGRKEFGAVSFGFIEVHDDEIRVLAETLELAQEIDLERAKKAQEKAEAELRAKEHFEEDMVKWQRKLQRSLIRQQAATLLPPH